MCLYFRSKMLPICPTVKMKFYVLLAVFLYSIPDNASGQANSCDARMGMENGAIPNSRLASSIDSSNPAGGRLNGASSWCYRDSDPNLPDVVTFDIDLGKVHFISGLLTQGPPDDLPYYRHAGFSILNSTSLDGDFQFYGGEKEVTFYTEEKPDESNVIIVHGFDLLMLARRIRIKFKTDIRYAGNDNKCFRFELLGCPSNVVPETNIQATIVASGWIQFSWSEPYVTISNSTGKQNLTLEIGPHYKTETVRTGASMPLSTVTNNLDPRLYMLQAPIWGASYRVSLTCPHQGVDLDCGFVVIEEAKINGCDPQQNDCPLEDRVDFQSPMRVSATSRTERGVTTGVDIDWEFEEMGWNPGMTTLLITDTFNVEVHKQEFDFQTTSVFLNMLSPGESYEVSFKPKVPGFQYVPENKYNLYLVPWSSIDGSSRGEGFGAFITDVHLRLYIYKNGTMLVTWTPALVRDKNDGVAPPPEEPAVVEATVDLTDTANSSTLDTSTTAPTTTVPTTIPITTAAPDVANVAETSEATAMKYNVTVFNDVTGEEIVTVVVNHGDGTSLFVEINDLMLETFYKVTLFCDFGGIMSSCGSSKIYTALPLTWTQMESQLLVYDLMEGGETWKKQEKTCQMSGGNLASLATDEEIELLRPTLATATPRASFNNFWIGLYMCQDNTGTLWSDGSKWEDHQLPSVDSGLSGTSCCIKAERDMVTLLYSWRGEPCESLLPALCEYKVEGLVGTILDFKTNSINTTKVNLIWNFDQKFWLNSRHILVICKIRYLGYSSEDFETTCSQIDIPPEKTDHQLDELNEFTEYEISIAPSLTPIKYTAPVTNLVTRTASESAVLWNIMDSGYIQFMLANKVVEFKDEENMLVTMERGDETVFADKSFPAKGINQKGTILGQNYKLTLKETTGPKTTHVISFPAFPKCPCENCQVKGWCHVSSSAPTNYEDAMDQCDIQKAIVASVLTEDRFAKFLEIANDEGDDLWVSTFSKKGSSLDSSNPGSASLVMEPDAETIFQTDEETTIAPTNPPGNPPPAAEGICLLLSRDEKAIIPADCEEFHLSACVYQSKITGTVPRALSDMDIQVGGTSIRLNWNDTNGWKSDIFVYYEKTFDATRYKRAISYVTVEKPPVVIANLDKDSTYNVEIENNVDVSYKELSDTFTIKTDNKITDLDKQISERFMVLAGWPPSEQHKTLHIACSFIIIAACVATMLLFFATGMFYQDCVAQLGFEFFLVISYILLLVHPTFIIDADMTYCTVIAICLHFSFLCAFVFLMFEALTIAHLLVTPIKSPFQRSNWILVLIGVACPFVYIIIVGGVLRESYISIDNHNCWLDAYGVPIYLEVIPNALIFISTIALLIASFIIKDTPPELIDVSLRARQLDTHKLRWVVGAEALLLLMVWCLGVGAFNTRNGGTHVAFHVFTLILALVILCFRTYFDDTLRSKLHRLCFGTELTYKRTDGFSISSANNKVRPAGMPPHSNGLSIQRSSTTSVQPDYTLPHTPPSGNGDKDSTVLIKRSYNFVE